jgi:hypothetical protein
MTYFSRPRSMLAPRMPATSSGTRQAIVRTGGVIKLLDSMPEHLAGGKGKHPSRRDIP